MDEKIYAMEQLQKNYEDALKIIAIKTVLSNQKSLVSYRLISKDQTNEMFSINYFLAKILGLKQENYTDKIKIGTYSSVFDLISKAQKVCKDNNIDVYYPPICDIDCANVFSGIPEEVINNESVYYLRHLNTSRCGFYRSYKVYVIKEGMILNITNLLINELNYKIDKNRGGAIRVYGCGLDVGYHMMDSIYIKLFGVMYDKEGRAKCPRVIYI